MPSLQAAGAHAVRAAQQAALEIRHAHHPLRRL